MPGEVARMKNEKGFTLLETLVGIAILAVVGIGLVAGLGTTFKMLSITNDRQHAKTLAQAQMEYVQGLPYPAPPVTYPFTYTPSSAISDEYADYYGVVISAEEIPGADANNSIQKVIVTVDHPFGQITLIDYKVDVNQQ